MKRDIFIGYKKLSSQLRSSIYLNEDSRFLHTHILGSSGSGKSSFILHKCIQDIKVGSGFALLDPHGDFSLELLRNIPKNRISDVIYFDLANLDFVTTINPLHNVPPSQYSLVVSNIVEILRTIFGHSWGPRLEDILRNTLFALVEQPAQRYPSLGLIPRFLTDTKFRTSLLENVTNYEVKNYFLYDYGRLNERMRQEAISSVLNKIRAFLADPIVRNVLCSYRPSLDIKRAMDDERIIICNLAQGAVGSTNARLVGSLVLSMIRLSAQSRYFLAEDQRTPFFVYIDEVQHFISDDLITSLPISRKFKLGYVISHQYRSQLPSPLLNAITETAGNFFAFSLSYDDVDFYSKILAPYLPAYLRSQDRGRAVARVSDRDMVSNLIDFEVPVLPKPTSDNSMKIIHNNQTHFCTPRSVIEKRLGYT